MVLALVKRELRGGVKGFRLFLACLFLGVAAIAAIGTMSAALRAGLAADARKLLGGDVEISLSNQPFPNDFTSSLPPGVERLSSVLETRAMVTSEDGGESRRLLVEVKVVDDAYPLVGELVSEPAMPLAQAFEVKNQRPGVLVDPQVLERLQLRVGDSLKLGETLFEIRGTVKAEPDRGIRGFELGPRLFVHQSNMAATGIIRPGSLVQYLVRVVLRSGPASADGWAEELRAKHPDALFRVRPQSEASPGVKRFIDRMANFLRLIALTALVIGGVGVSNAVRAYLETKIQTIATLKAVGASSGLILAVYLSLIGILALLGVTLGCAVGAVAPFALQQFAGPALPIRIVGALYPAPLVAAATFGLLTAALFSLLPLSQVIDIKPAALFRARVANAAVWPRWPIVLGIVATGLAMMGLALAQTRALELTLGYIGGLVVAFALFALAARFTVLLAGKVPRRWLVTPVLRQAISNLYRPGSATSNAMLSLGLGLTVLCAIALVESNLKRELGSDILQKAPAFFFVDVQNEELESFKAALSALPGVDSVESTPALRGRIVRIKGVPVAQVSIPDRSRWVVESDRGITYKNAPPPNAKVVEGEWWPQDYVGPPLLSFDVELASDLNVAIGDTLTINVLGREIEASIKNLREIDWRSFGINFAMVLSPGLLEGAPQSHLATARATPSSEGAVFSAIGKQFPGVSMVRVRDAIEAVQAMLANITLAVRIAALFTLVAGLFVLAGGLLATHQRRLYEAVVLKVLGATRAKISAIFLLEYALVGGASAAVATILGSLASYAVVVGVLEGAWQFSWLALATTLAAGLVVTLSLALGGTWYVLSQSSAQQLRND